MYSQCMFDPKTKFNTKDYSKSSKTVNMNFCNYAKVIIGRNSKEPQRSFLTEWEKQNLKCDIRYRYRFYSNIVCNYQKCICPMTNLSASYHVYTNY